MSEDSPIVLQASKWSEIPAVLDKYMEMVASGDGVSRIFGYASLIPDTEGGNLGVKGNSKLENEIVSVPGMEVGMNVQAIGAYEFRGTNLKDEEGNRIVSTGLYAGLAPADSMDTRAAGKNITHNLEDAQAGIVEYLKREFGNTPPSSFPEGASYEDLFTKEGAQKFAQLKGTEQDNINMYALQVLQTQKADGTTAPALTVATNPDSPMAAIDISAEQAALRILSGEGVNGSAKAYFDNTFKNHAELMASIGQPVSEKMQAIKDAMPRMEQYVQEYVEVKGDLTKLDDLFAKFETKTVKGNTDLVAKGNDVAEYSQSSFYSPYHDEKAKNAERPNPGGEKEQRVKNLPRDGQSWLEYIAERSKAERKIEGR